MTMIQVHFVAAQPGTLLAGQLLAGLAPAEQARIARFRRAPDQHRSIVARAALRGLLARTLGVPAAAVPLSTAASGQPRVQGAAPWHVSVSHSEAMAVVVLAQAPVGVDVEAERIVPDAAAMAQAWFTPAEAAQVASQPADFLALWTAKEAVVKALGTGLTAGLADFSVTRPADEFRPVATGTDSRFAGLTVRRLAAPAGYHAALSIRAHAPAAPQVHHHDTAWLQALARCGVAPSDTEILHGQT